MGVWSNLRSFSASLNYRDVTNNPKSPQNNEKNVEWIILGNERRVHEPNERWKHKFDGATPQWRLIYDQACKRMLLKYSADCEVLLVNIQSYKSQALCHLSKTSLAAPAAVLRVGMSDGVARPGPQLDASLAVRLAVMLWYVDCHVNAVEILAIKISHRWVRRRVERVFGFVAFHGWAVGFSRQVDEPEPDADEHLLDALEGAREKAKKRF